MDMNAARALIPRVSKVRIVSTARTGPMIGCAEDPIPQESDIGTVCTFKRLDWGGEGSWDVLVLVRDDGQHLFAVNEDCEIEDDKRYIEVIVSRCRWNGEQFSLCGNRVHESKHRSPSEALATAMSLRGENLSVTIRPSFNETDEEGVESYREWRSFSGSTFKEIRFYCGGERIPESKEVPDSEVRLPWVVNLHDPNPRGLPMWMVTSIALIKDNIAPEEGCAGAWWFECKTQEGALILVGEMWGDDLARKAQVHVSDAGHKTRSYGGEAAAERVIWFRKFWEAVCAEAGKNPDEEHWFVFSQEEHGEQATRQG